MAESTKKYTITLIPRFQLVRRSRAGIEFGQGETKVVELTKDQVAEFKDDRFFSVKTGSKSAPQSDDAGASEADVESTEASTAVDTGSEDQETTVSDQNDEEEADSEGSELDTLTRDNNREQLNKLAIEAGVLNPDELNTKGDVAEAIIAARG